MTTANQIKTIADYHHFMGLGKPQHPLISVVKFEDIKSHPSSMPRSIIHHFYSIALKKNNISKLKYGQQNLDFDEGVMHFMAPKQVLSFQPGNKEDFQHTGWLLLIHPDFLWNTSLAGKIKKYEYFSYNVNEALHLSEKEEILVIDIIQKIEQEYNTNIDYFSQDVIVAQIEVLLTYSERFYQRQFITRKKNNHKILDQTEALLAEYFASDALITKGIPTVQYVAENLNISANYLSRILHLLTGQSTKQLIQDRMIDLGKEKLSTTNLSVSEIAYALGFEHPQSFSKLFKVKTDMSPMVFRASFN